MRNLGLFCVTLLALVFQPAAAQEKSPLQLEGVAMFTDGRSNVTAHRKLDVETQAPDGAIQGRLTYIGKVCQFKDAVVAGTYRDGNLEFEVQKAVFGCDKLGMKLKEVRAGSREFEGTGNLAGPGRYSQAFDITLTVSAKSR
jgi:hypothetical protein